MTDTQDGDDRTPVPAEIMGEVLNAMVSKAVEAVVMMQTNDQILAATIGGAAGGSAKSVVAGAQRFFAQRQKRIADAAEASTEVSGLTLRELVEHGLQRDDESRLDLLLDAFREASRENDGRKVRAYGRLAATGVLAEVDAEVARARRVFETLAELDDADLRLLLHMCRQPDQDWFLFPNPDVHDVRVIVEELPELDELGDPVTSRLTAAGLLVAALGRTKYTGALSVTPFARTCMIELMRGADAGTSS